MFFFIADLAVLTHSVFCLGNIKASCTFPLIISGWASTWLSVLPYPLSLRVYYVLRRFNLILPKKGRDINLKMLTCLLKCQLVLFFIGEHLTPEIVLYAIRNLSHIRIYYIHCNSCLFLHGNDLFKFCQLDLFFSRWLIQFEVRLYNILIVLSFYFSMYLSWLTSSLICIKNI